MSCFSLRAICSIASSLLSEASRVASTCEMAKKGITVGSSEVDVLETMIGTSACLATGETLLSVTAITFAPWLFTYCVARTASRA